MTLIAHFAAQVWGQVQVLVPGLDMTLKTAGAKFSLHNGAVTNIWWNIFSLTGSCNRSPSPGSWKSKSSLSSNTGNEDATLSEDYDADYEPSDEKSPDEQEYFSDASVSSASMDTIVLR